MQFDCVVYHTPVSTSIKLSIQQQLQKKAFDMQYLLNGSHHLCSATVQQAKTTAAAAAASAWWHCAAAIWPAELQLRDGHRPKPLGGGSIRVYHINPAQGQMVAAACSDCMKLRDANKLHICCLLSLS